MFDVKLDVLNIINCYLLVKMLLKSFFFIFGISIFSHLHGQTINQLDSDGLRHGVWQKTYDGSKQLRYSGRFEHGKEVGIFNFYDKDGGHPTAVKRYTSGSDLLDVSFYTKEGKKVSEGTMKGRLREGDWTYYHQDGTSILSTERYKNDLKEGKKIEYYNNGIKALEESYIAGKREGVALYYTEDQVLLKELTYQNDLLNGLAKLYDPLGVLIKEGTYKNNKKHGIWRYYKDAKLDKEVRFPQNRIGVEH